MKKTNGWSPIEDDDLAFLRKARVLQALSTVMLAIAGMMATASLLFFVPLV